MKTIHTLIEDIEEVLEGKGGWSLATSEFFANWIKSKSHETFGSPQEERSHIGLSAVGKPCDRQKWLTVNEPGEGEELDPNLYGTFFYGDMVEAFVLSLAVAAGHRVEGFQEKLSINGIDGSGDAIIDGIVVDVKSAAGFAFNKFQYNQLKGYEDKKGNWVSGAEVDKFGYISQLSSYLYAYRDDPRVHDKENAAFLAVNKERFKLHLDFYNFKEELAKKEEEINYTLEVIGNPDIPSRLPDVKDGESGNRKLSTVCSYCNRKKRCWPDARLFMYSGGPRWLTKVVKDPTQGRGNVREIK